MPDDRSTDRRMPAPTRSNDPVAGSATPSHENGPATDGHQDRRRLLSRVVVLSLVSVLFLVTFAVVPGTAAASQGETYVPGETSPDEYTVWIVNSTNDRVEAVYNLTDDGDHLNVTKNGQVTNVDVVDRQNTSAVITAAAEDATEENSTLVVGPGRYNVSPDRGTWWTGPVNVTADDGANVSRVVADGAASGETVLTAVAGSPEALLEIENADADGIEIGNLSFEGVGAARTSVGVTTTAPDADVALSNVTINDTTRSGLWVGLSLASLTVTDSTISNAGVFGIGVVEPTADTVAVTDSIVRDNGATGAYLENTTGAEFRNNTITSNGGSGLYVQNSSDGVFDDNALRDNDRWEVEIDGDSANNTVRDLDLGTSTTPNTTVSFEGRNASVRAQPSPSDPHHIYDDHLESVGRYAEVKVHGDGYLNLTIHYAEGDTDVTDPDDLGLWVKAPPERWGKLFEASVDTSARTVGYNMTKSGLTATFGVFEDTTATLEGTIQDQSGTGIDGAAVFVHDKGFQNRLYNGNLDGGEYDLALPPGTYTVEGDADGNATAMERDVELVASGSTTVDLQLPAAAYIEGYLNADGGGTVSPDAGVIVNDGQRIYFDNATANGHYELEVPAGTHDVVGFDPTSGNMTADVPQVTVEAGERADDGSVTNVTLVNAEVRNENVTIVEGNGEQEHLALAHGLEPPVFMGMALVNGSAPSDDPEARPPVDLTAMGVDETTEFRIEFTVDGFSPDSLMWGAKDVEWDTEPNAAGSGTNVTVNASAVHLAGVEASNVSGVDQPIGPQIGNDLEQISWPEGEEDSAPSDLNWNKTVYFGMLDTAAMPPAYRSQLQNVTVTTNAQMFTTPQVSDERLRIYVAGPGKRPDGSTHTGFYRAFVPEGLLAEWGVDDPATELDVLYKGDSRNFDVQVVDDGPRGAAGAWIEITDIGYSDGVIDVEPQPDTGGDGSTGSSTRTGGGSGGSGETTTAPTTRSEVTEQTESRGTDEPVQETETPTSESSTRETATTDTPTDASTDAPATTATSGQPGFGAIATAFALLAGALAVRRRR